MARTDHLKHESKLRENVRRAIRNGDRRLIRSAIRNYLNSHAARFVAATEAVGSCKRRSHKPIAQIAREMNVWQPCDERASVNVTIKEVQPGPDQGGEYDYRPRIWVSFGPENQAQQILVRNLLKAIWNVSASQMMFNGGSTRAVQRVKQFYAEGHRYILEVDIYRCFQSFDRQGIARFLCLPEKVNDHVLGASSLNLHPSLSCKREVLYHSPKLSGGTMDLFMETFREYWDPAQLGLIEGSKVSSFAAELLLAPICEVLAECGVGQIVNFADNFLLMARSKSELRELYNILREGLHTHPAGPLQVNDLQKMDADNESFVFLGYKFIPSGEELVCTWGPKSEASARKLRREAHRALASNMPVARKESRLKDVERKHKEIIGAFSEWPGGADFHHKKMEAMRRHLTE